MQRSFHSFILLILSLVLVRIFTVALRLTGLSDDVARFQARSAYTGTGFTTNESETVVNDPVRRRIIMFVMLLRGAGAITATVTLLLSFINVDSVRQGFERGLLLALGLLLLLLFSRSQIASRLLTRVIEWALRRWTDVDVRDYVNLLHLQDDYRIYEIGVHEMSWMAGVEIQQLQLLDEGVLVLGIRRSNGHYVGAPRGETVVHPGDVIILYGKADRLAELSRRPAGEAGDRAHREAVDRQDETVRDQDDRERRGGYAEKRSGRIESEPRPES